MPDVIQMLRRFVAFPTVSTTPNLAFAAEVATRSEACGFRIERFFDPENPEICSVMATIGPPNTDGLILSGHLDVVPTEGQPWTSDPFVLTQREGLLYGRGTADMKGFIAATLVALQRIPPRAYRKELVLLWTHDEEIGCRGSAAIVDALINTPRPLPKNALIGEPTSFQVLRMHPGHVAVEVLIRGRAAHSSRPDLGQNTLHDAADVIQSVRELSLELTNEPIDLPELVRPVVAVNIAQIEGGGAINIVPDHCTLRIGYRPLPGQDPLDVYQRIQDRVLNLPGASRVKARVLRVTPSLLTPKHTPLSCSLRPFAHGDVGAATFATDGGNLARLGIQPLVFGPGSINVAHRADEYVPLSELTRAVDIIEAVVRHHCC